MWVEHLKAVGLFEPLQTTDYHALFDLPNSEKIAAILASNTIDPLDVDNPNGEQWLWDILGNSGNVQALRAVAGVIAHICPSTTVAKQGLERVLDCATFRVGDTQRAQEMDMVVELTNMFSPTNQCLPPLARVDVEQYVRNMDFLGHGGRWNEKLIERFCPVWSSYPPHPHAVAFHLHCRLKNLLETDVSFFLSGGAGALFEQLWGTLDRPTQALVFTEALGRVCSSSRGDGGQVSELYTRHHSDRTVRLVPNTRLLERIEPHLPDLLGHLGLSMEDLLDLPVATDNVEGLETAACVHNAVRSLPCVQRYVLEKHISGGGKATVKKM